MDTSIDKADFDNLPSHTKEKIEEQIDYGKKTIEIEKDLRTNPRYKEFFDRYTPSSVDSFIKHYAANKTRYLKYGEMFKSEEEKRSLQFLDEAQERIWDIQQKKLFDLQCQWRAELITLPGVEVCFDFMYWGINIKACPFLEPITEEELHLFIAFILSENYANDNGFLFSWQDYTTFNKQNNDDEHQLPIWYQYYNEHMNTAHLFRLPDIRGEKEMHYLLRERKQDEIETQKRLEANLVPPPDKRPYLSCDGKQLENFIIKFEDKKLLTYYRVSERALHKIDDDDDLNNAYEFLKSIDEPVALEEMEDWRDAIKITARRFKLKYFSEACEPAYAYYLQRIKLGIPFEANKMSDNLLFYKNLSDTYK